MSDNRVRVWFSLFVLAVFCLGLAAGVVIGRRMVGFPGPPFGPGFGGPGRGRGGPPPERLVERLTSELQLNADQRTQIDAILKARRQKLEDLQHDVHARFEREQQELRDEIRKVLTPDQQQHFDKLMQDEPRGPGRRGRPPRQPGNVP
ncbi:MAG TPA: hypothetical protein VHI99_08345 [Vicinamibacterales bacterium]|nr:hypothetical protein [Vicinamibacterales bacterium]